MHIFQILLLTVSILLGNASHAYAETSGSFVGASDHVTRGEVTITANDDGTHTVTLSADFFLDGAPDPYVGFGRSGSFSTDANLGVLKSTTGSQSYIVPASIDPADFNEIYIWCLKFAVPLGVAQLN